MLTPNEATSNFFGKLRHGNYVPFYLPESPIDYLSIINNPDGGLSGTLSTEAKKKNVLVIGAGVAGLTAAYELLKKGLQPKIYEPQDALGGRLCTKDMAEKNAPGGIKFCELGAMRIPITQGCIFSYLYNLGVTERQFGPTYKYTEKSNKQPDIYEPWPEFPSPKATDTRIYFRGKTVFYTYDATSKQGYYVGDPDLIQRINKITSKYRCLISQDLQAMREIDNNFFKAHPQPTIADLQIYNGARLAQWKQLIDKYQQKTLYAVLVQDTTTGLWTEEDIILLATIGIGTGGVGALYDTTYLETLRESYQLDDIDQRLIQGGMKQLIDAFALHHPKNSEKNLAEINKWSFAEEHGFPKIKSHTRKRVVKIRTAANPLDPITVWHETWSDTKQKWVLEEPEQFDAVILTASLRAIEMYIDINNSAFSDHIWNSIRNFGMIDANKIFFYCNTQWWKEWNKEHPDPIDQISTTLTDRSLHQIYFMDNFGNDPYYKGNGGVVLLSYCWAKHASKFIALSLPEKVALCMKEFKEIFPEGAYEKFTASLLPGWESGNGITEVNWNSIKYVNGAFRMATPGQYSENELLYQQGRGNSNLNNGLYLAGESLAWYGLSGWVDGAMQSGINAAQAVIERFT